MAKKQAPKQYNVADLQPDELSALKNLVREFVEKVQNVDNEIELLKNDRKELVEEYADKLDLRTLQAALKVAKITSEVAHRDTFDAFLSVLLDEES